LTPADLAVQIGGNIDLEGISMNTIFDVAEYLLDKSYFGRHPHWAFSYADRVKWDISYNFHAIIDRLASFEKMTWQDIQADCMD
jgi:hypothetical protein